MRPTRPLRYYCETRTNSRNFSLSGDRHCMSIRTRTGFFPNWPDVNYCVGAGSNVKSSTSGSDTSVTRWIST
eukprot:scaffold519834_cov31-Prasinocladus_malaysianus.AAC.1